MSDGVAGLVERGRGSRFVHDGQDGVSRPGVYCSRLGGIRDALGLASSSRRRRIVFGTSVVWECPAGSLEWQRNLCQQVLFIQHCPVVVLFRDSPDWQSTSLTAIYLLCMFVGNGTWSSSSHRRCSTSIYVWALSYTGL